jgi:hypothetical protein
MAASRGRPKKADKVLILMKFGAGWMTPSGVSFTKDHPFQLVPTEEVEALLSNERFERAGAEDLQKYYQL